MKSSRIHRALVLVSSAALALGLSACSAAESDGSDEFTILFVGGVTGQLADTTESAIWGMEAAVEEINENGGVDGKDVVLEVKDDQSDPTKAVSVLQEALNEETPDIVIPSGSSAEALAMLPVLTRNEIVSVGFGASPLLNDPEKYPYHFQTTPSSSAQLVGLQDHLEKTGVKKLGVLVSEDEYGEGVVAAIESQLEGSGVEIETTEFTPGDVDLRVPYERMLDGDPDFVYLDTTGDAAIRLLEARTQVGAVGIPTIAGSGMSLTAGGPAKYGSPEANKNLEILVFKVEVAQPESKQSDAFKEFFERYSAKGEITQSMSTPALSWDQVRLAARAANEDGAMDDYPSSFVDSIYNLEVEGGYWLTEKTFEYSEKDHSPTPVPEDFPFIPSSPQKNGQYQVASAS